MKKLHLFLAFASAVLVSGCATQTVYQDPVAKFQTAVLNANSTVAPYFQNINALNLEANLYDKIGEDKPWGSEDLVPAIPAKEIQLRLSALSAITSYVNALAAVASGKDEQSLDQAAQTLGTNVNNLQTTVLGIGAARSSGSLKGALSAPAAKLDISKPVTALVTLFGNLYIEQKQKAALESAIIAGDKPIGDLLDQLAADLHGLQLLDTAAYEAMQNGKIVAYAAIRKAAAPKDLPSVVYQFSQDMASLQTLESLQLDTLFNDVKAAHTALVVFAKSSKQPKDLSELSSEIDVLTQHVQLFQNALSSLQSLNHSSK